MFSIKTKLSIGITILIAILFSIAAWLLVTEKRNELARDIYTNTRSFSELTSGRIVDLYENLLREYSFVLFNREMADVFSKNADISTIRIYTYSGEILYNSQTESLRQYVGEKRMVKDEVLLKRIRAQLPNVQTTLGRTVYLKKNSKQQLTAVDEFERPIHDVGDIDESRKSSGVSEELVGTIMYPLDGTYAIEYGVTYDNLEARVAHTTQRILLLALFGVLIGLACAVVYSRRLTRPIDTLTTSARKLGQGDLTSRVTVTSNDEIGVLADTFNKMAADLQVSTKAMVEREKLARELELAAKIQRQIIPKELPQIEGLEVATSLIPANEVGGDCYDFIKLDEERQLMYISDVTGHGVPSGLVVSIANALIYSFAGRGSIKELLVNVNRVLKQKTSQNMFMTLLMLEYHKAPKQEPVVTMVSAGHPEMLHYHALTGEVTTEQGGGIALGMVPDIGKMLTERNVVLEKGDVLALYSDGIPEAASEATNTMYGIAAFEKSMKKASQLSSAEEVKDVLISDVKAFMADSKQLDDITLVVLKRTA